MLKDILILFFSPILAGLAVYLVPKVKSTTYKLSLVFAGSYLFSITIMHILPGLFTVGVNPEKIGLYVLLGFFMQLFLEKFSSGIEHGHIHLHEKDSHQGISVVFLLSALFLHAFLEGTLLAPPNAMHDHHGKGSLLFGIALHKMPAAFALMSVLRHQMIKKNKAILYLLIFAVASPAGLLLTNYFNEFNLISDEAFTILFAIVSGNFLHISTTIFIESSPEHRFQANKLLVSAIAALIAILAEYMS